MAIELLPGVEVEEVVLILIVVMLIEGVWLAGLTYLLWKRAQQRKAQPPEEDEEPPDDPTMST